MRFRDTLVTVVLCGIFYRATGQIVYDLGTGTTTWQHARTLCTLATPRLKYTSTDIQADLGAAMVKLLEGEEAWLGYLQDFVVFQYVGCLKYDLAAEPRLSVFIDTGSDPGRCFSACGSRGYFGVMMNKCFCFATMPTTNIHMTKCTTTCSALKNEAACGGTDVVSIYSDALGMSVSNLTEHMMPAMQGNCVLYNQNTRQFLPTKCSLSYKIGCESDAGVEQNVGDRALTWMDMTSFCYSMRLVPFKASNAVTSSENTQIWTGLVKSSKIYEEIQGTSQPKAYGYVRRVNGIMKVFFETASLDKSKRFVCQTGTITTDGNTGPPDWSETTAFAPSAAAEGSSLLAVYILIPILIIVVIGVLVFLVVRWRRKQRKRGLQKLGLIDKPAGKTGKKRKSYEGTHTNQAVDMYDISDVSPSDGESRKVSLAGTGLRANVSLDRLDESDEPFAARTTKSYIYDGRPRSAISENGVLEDKPRPPSTISEKGPPRSVGRPETKVERESKYENTGDTTSDGKKNDNEYARINKIRRGGNPPTLADSAETYNRLDKEKNHTPEHDKVGGGDVYENKPKVVTVTPVDNPYDGLSRF